ncbi:precorrin-6Y C5,15-methyltransferase (decarboxylating) subunit CbiT [Nitrososphaera sp.]|uniref:precorrin-6Y C5,15-methyltransferase (decarboxylating) subunit CbiT n=1 Tax=Nitrososphaera sp. TaxID=1971748 RepID=UPI0017D8337C|nr:precorrin-6Y C5,15-methyltransferase (decarboxylating) subunit CbiT [Nitrososphaera sp.]NWG36677.1 precorrin-6Y C5,15-methyltransferase (decarboxylating) subunit CbiT [Nitrososphaera sp.]
MWDSRTPGIPDELFERTEEVPITKEDVRALVISKLRLREGQSAIDVGCGSGSITVELCLQTRGEVHAIDFDQNAIELTKKNLKKFGVSAHVVQGKAQDVLPELPQVDAVVVGGTWGDAGKVIELAVGRLKKGGRIVIDTILIETMYHALAKVSELQLADIDVTQVTIAKARKVTTGTMMLARNPVLLISATKP